MLRGEIPGKMVAEISSFALGCHIELAQITDEIRIRAWVKAEN